MRKLKSGYPLKVWLTTLVVGPPLFLGTLFLKGKGTADMAGAFWAILLVSLVLSLPAFLLNILLCRKIAAGNFTTERAKSAVAGAGVGFVGLTFAIMYLFSGGSGDEDLFFNFPIGYMIASVIATFCFQLRTDAAIFQLGEAALPAEKLE